MPYSNKSYDILTSLPNRLTLARVLAIPLLLFFYPMNIGFFNYLCTLIFAVAAATDFLDGFLARRYNLTSRFGAVIDPIADKLLVTSTLILLASADQLPAFMAALLVCREIAVSGLRIAALEQKFTLDVDSFGKIKTLVLDFAIVCLMPQTVSLRQTGILAMWAALLLSYYSAYRYWQTFWSKSDSAANLS
jgi:CDP-diacylglycerol--glycerol-3-phosphate 3-phosphatidyltransferase